MSGTAQFSEQDVVDWYASHSRMSQQEWPPDMRGEIPPVIGRRRAADEKARRRSREVARRAGRPVNRIDWV